MTETDIPRGIGDNQPPDDLAITLAAVVEDASPYLSGADIRDDAQAEAIAAIVTRAIEAARAVEAAEEVEKRPHLDAATAIRARYKAAYADAVKKAEAVAAAGKALLSKWQRAKEAKRAEEAAKLSAEAEAQKAAAREALQAAGGDLDARLQAEEAAETAKRNEIAAKAVGKLKVAPQVGGRTLRHRKVYRAAPIVDAKVDAAIAWAWEENWPRVWEVLEPLIREMAEQSIKARSPKPGRYVVGESAVMVEVSEEAF